MLFLLLPIDELIGQRSHLETFFGKRADHRDTQSIFHLAVGRCPEKEMSLFRNMLGQPLHEQFHLKQGHVLAAADVHQNSGGVGQERSAVEQRTSQGGLQSRLGPILAPPQSGTKQTTRTGGLESRHQLIQPHVDQSGTQHEARDGSDAVGNHAVGS